MGAGGAERFLHQRGKLCLPSLAVMGQYEGDLLTPFCLLTGLFQGQEELSLEAAKEEGSQEAH